MGGKAERELLRNWILCDGIVLSRQRIAFIIIHVAKIVFTKTRRIVLCEWRLAIR